MEKFAQQLRFHTAASEVDFSGLLAGVRALAPRCAECGVPLDFALTGIRFRMTEAGDEEKLCRSVCCDGIWREFAQQPAKVSAGSV